jgi:putative nucleotidyltransferase with HDIG domain
MRTKLRAVVLNNLPASVLPALFAWAIVSAIGGRHTDHAAFYLAVGLAALVAITLSFALFASLRRAFLPELTPVGWRAFIDFLPSIGLNVAIVVAATAITVNLGTAGLVFALAGVLSFSYMAQLVAKARKRSQEYVSLSWGVLAGLIRAMDVRDPRAARHAAAVARYSRDIAHAVGMSEREVELAHTAGMLHDVGHFALSDRVAERGRPLTEEDWDAIQRHPDLGADMLRDLGMYGPVAEIVRAHHERIDGRGYPQGLSADEIPEIAKIIAVAEVYDTLTASDTYRTRMSSFEAIRELRRVAGSQLEYRYVETLIQLLSGEDISYRHADHVDFDRELDMQRRIRQAAAGG